MEKENIPPPNPHLHSNPLTAEQRARITHNFRAAKARLARKRPLDFDSPPLLSKFGSAKGADAPHCVPLSEVNSGAKPCQDRPDNPGSILDEELDEVFLKEVDAICEQRSTAKKERPSSDRKESPGEASDLLQDKDEGLVPDKYQDHLKKLNDEQREAACFDISVPLMIVAGPGSGKTSTMVGRVLTLLQKGIGPTNILVMTFTTAAASEMRDRIGAVVGKAVAKEITISTFHSFCL